ncbi:3-dehydroquinate synthase [Cephaloticoccus primus]|uniref:3-dehydroquinate synthase n=1 Tax=Cephaloticoccus primus TaxID=1548207 RepID=A0A139SJF2_9BACT|nr:3-dehydroquinate synthase [Cephaloticoccus primus]KXU34677.1 3-dehydroquinate synthase [Cephaloticoccus primus]
MVETLELSFDDPSRNYPILLGEDLSAPLRQTLAALRAEGRRAVLLTDANLAAAQPAFLKNFGTETETPRLVFAAGEGTKSVAELARVWDFLAAQRVDRGGVIFAVGGGVVGDLAGFAAASWQRGISFYQVPTTLLAMVDSSVGGKTGINIPAGKNLVGAFHQPRAVFVSTALLRTLPAREFAAGMAEVIKYGLLADAQLFAQLEAQPLRVTSPELAQVIRRCCEIKAQIVRADERETALEGGRALLNLGHTFGHAVEQVAGYGEYLHGEAVSLGLVAAAELSRRLGHIDTAACERVARVLRAHDLPLRLRAPLPIEALISAMQRDKKVRAGLPRFVVLRALGEAITQDGIGETLARDCFATIAAPA